MAEVLKKLKRDAEDGHFHEKIERVVITCPAEFNAIQRQKIEEAGRLGLRHTSPDGVHDLLREVSLEYAFIASC